MEKVEPGKWYLTVDCKNCTRGLAFAEAPPEGEAAYLPNKLQLTCHVCGHAAEYDPSEVRRSQGQQKH